MPASHTAHNDPNDSGNLGTGTNAQGEDDDGAFFYIRASGSGRGDIHVQSTWQWKVTGINRLTSLVGADVDRFRSDDLTTVGNQRTPPPRCRTAG